MMATQNWITNLVAAAVAGGISIAGTSARMSEDVAKINQKLDSIEQRASEKGEVLARIEVRLDQVEKRGR